MKNRIISGVVIALVLSVVLYFGGIVFDIGVSIVAVMAFKELIDVKKDALIPISMKIVGLVCMLMLLLLNLDGHTLVVGINYRTLAIMFLCLFTPTIFFKKNRYRIIDAFYLTTITLFIGVVFNLFSVLFNESIYLFIFVLLIACVTDIFALFGGLLIGQHKLTPISPKKTIEGAIVGTIMSVIVSTTYYAALIDATHIGKIVGLVFILSIIGQMGDIFFSLIKRENDIKDFSNLIPGHGGILDRLDSIIFILIAFVSIMHYL